MGDEEDWKLWRQVVNPMATDFLRLALEERENFLSASDPAEKRLAARDFMTLLFCAAEAMGADEIGAWAYGDDPAPDSPHAEHLRVLAGRLALFADAYDRASPTDYKYSVPAVAREIGYMAEGDAPMALRRALRDANRTVPRRTVEHWARALMWVAFLSQSNKRVTDCRNHVAREYGVSSELLKDWKNRVREVLGESRIAEIERAATRTPLGFRFETEDEGRAALKADAKAFRDFEREQSGAVRKIRGNRNPQTHGK